MRRVSCLFVLLVLLGSAGRGAAQTVRIERLVDGPIIRPDMDASMGGNIAGPSLIRVPDSPFQSRNEPEAEAREPRLTGDRISGSKQGSWRGAVKSAHADGHYVPWRRRWVVGARAVTRTSRVEDLEGLQGIQYFDPEEGWRASC